MTDWYSLVWNAICSQHNPDGLCWNCREGLVGHMVQVTMWTLRILAACCFVRCNSNGATKLKRCSFLFPFSTTMQYVIYTYMKHLGVRVKEPRSLESKRVRINFLPKIKVPNMTFGGFSLLSLSRSPFILHLTLPLLLIHYRKASGQKRKEKRRWRKPDFPVSLDLSVGPAALKQLLVRHDSTNKPKIRHSL